jgi:type 1 glutamine amidotransferase
MLSKREDRLMDSQAIKVAVVTGMHPFEVPPFIQLFRSLEGVDAYVQDLENYCLDLAHVRDEYDAVLFYNMHREPPEGCREALESLGQTKQGLLFLHHGVLAFRDWPLWSEIIGIEDRSFTYKAGETVSVEIADADHPITRGMAPWTMTDEVYAMHEPGGESHVLLTTEHPQSLHALAWTRRYQLSRVFVLASGHGEETYTDPNFREVLRRGIAWLAGRI